MTLTREIIEAIRNHPVWAASDIATTMEALCDLALEGKAALERARTAGLEEAAKWHDREMEGVIAFRDTYKVNSARWKEANEFYISHSYAGKAIRALASSPRMTGFYVASKTVHASMWRACRADGVKIISTWIDEAGKGETRSFEDLWRRCVSEASNCTALIAYRENGEILKGALVEIGAALANNRRVYFVGDIEGYSFASHPLVTRCETVNGAIYQAEMETGLRTLDEAKS